MIIIIYTYKMYDKNNSNGTLEIVKVLIIIKR